MAREDTDGVCPSCDQQILDDEEEYLDGNTLDCPLCSEELVVIVEGKHVTFLPLLEGEEW